MLAIIKGRPAARRGSAPAGAPEAEFTSSALNDCDGSSPRGGAGERGSALVIALLVVVIMTLLGLSFMLGGETESKIARNQRDTAQAGFVAEGGVRMVKKWFDAPGGVNAHLVPFPSQMDRTLRWVDDNNDGTYGAYASATAPFDVVYKQGVDRNGDGTEDLFEKPYRGSPALAFLGIEGHPDILISESGSPGQQTYLSNLNSSLYPSFPGPSDQRARIRQIEVYGPPILVIGGQRTRYGIATVKVTADIYQYAGSANETRVATRIVKAVLNEVPFLGGPGGPLQSCVDMPLNGSFSVHWGMASSVGTMTLANNIGSKVDSSVPYKPTGFSFIQPDMDGDGSKTVAATPGTASTATADDRDYDGTLDFTNWLALPNVEDPWLRYMSQGDIVSGGITPGCTGPDCQPMPFYRTASNSLGGGTDDHSNLFKNVSLDLCPQYDYQFWKNIALGGGENVYYYQSVGGGNFKLFGQATATAVDFRTAVNGKNGLFFFDTATNTAPVDADGNGTFDNLTADVNLSGGALTTGGFIYLNANLGTNGNGGVAFQRQLIAPGEPFIDANGNHQYDPDEWFIDLTYDSSPTGGPGYQKNGIYRVIDGIGPPRQDPALDAAAAGKYMADINMLGVFYTNGAYDAQGNFVFFGTVVTKSGMTPSAGTPDFYWDERLVKDLWPPFELNLPRTVITAWETDL